MITRSKDEDDTIWQDALTMALRRAKWTYENVPSQGPSAIFWHAKDFATAHEVAAGAWETPPAVIRWLKMLSRMARWFSDPSRIWTFPLPCVHLVSISGQCDASIWGNSNEQRIDLGKKEHKTSTWHQAIDNGKQDKKVLYFEMINKNKQYSFINIKRRWYWKYE